MKQPHQDQSSWFRCWPLAAGRSNMLPPSQPQIGRFCCLRRRVEDLPGRCRHVAMFAYCWPRLRSRLAPNRVKRSSGRLRRRPESGGQVRAVVVPEDDKYPEHDERDRGQTAHSLIFVTHGGRPPRISGAKRSARSCRSRLTDERMRVSSAVTDTTSVSRSVLSQPGSSAKAGQEHHQPGRTGRALRPRRARSRGPGGTDLRGGRLGCRRSWGPATGDYPWVVRRVRQRMALAVALRALCRNR